MSDNKNLTSSCCCSGSTQDLDTTVINPGTTNLLDSVTDETTCPVMPGTAVDEAAAEAAGLFRDHRGRRYWFCCKGCGPRFDRDPDKYAQRGVTDLPNPGAPNPQTEGVAMTHVDDADHCPTSGSVHHGYITDKDKYRKRLKRIEGQARGISRMIEDNRYCIDILTQADARTKALQSVSLALLDDHIRHCVRDAATAGGSADSCGHEPHRRRTDTAPRCYTPARNDT